MNRRNKNTTKKIEFEPKIPIPQVITPKNDKLCEIEPVVQKQESEKEMIQMLRGLNTPQSFSIPKDFDITKDGFVMNLPECLIGSSLVVFNDGTLGIRRDGIVYECESAFLGDGIAVEVGDKIRKIGNVDFMLTSYEIEKE